MIIESNISYQQCGRQKIIKASLYVGGVIFCTESVCLLVRESASVHACIFAPTKFEQLCPFVLDARVISKLRSKFFKTYLNFKQSKVFTNM